MLAGDFRPTSGSEKPQGDAIGPRATLYSPRLTPVYRAVARIPEICAAPIPIQAPDLVTEALVGFTIGLAWGVR
jgi:hypothetical protein